MVEKAAPTLIGPTPTTIGNNVSEQTQNDFQERNSFMQFLERVSKTQLGEQRLLEAFVGGGKT